MSRDAMGPGTPGSGDRSREAGSDGLPDSGAGGDRTGALPVLPPATAMAELLVMVLVIVALEWLLPSQSLADIGPNPYWLPVLLMSLQYGTVSGLIAADVGILMTMLPGVPEQSVGENHFVYLLRIWAQPILWIAVAVLLGQFRMRQIANKQALKRQVDELSGQRRALADYSANLRQRLQRLEQSHASRMTPGTSDVVAGLAALGDRARDLEGALRHASALLLPGAAVSVFALEGQRLLKLADTRPADAAPRSEEIAATHPLYGAVIGRAETPCVLDSRYDAVLAGEGLAAVPVRVPGIAGIAGLVKLDDAAPDQVGDDTLATLSVLAALVGQRLAEDAGDVASATAGEETERMTFGRQALGSLVTLLPRRIGRARLGASRGRSEPSDAAQ